MATKEQIETLIDLKHFRAAVLSMFSQPGEDVDPVLADMRFNLTREEMQSMFTEPQGLYPISLVEYFCKHLTEEEATDLVSFFKTEASMKLWWMFRRTIIEVGRGWMIEENIRARDARTPPQT